MATTIQSLPRLRFEIPDAAINRARAHQLRVDLSPKVGLRTLITAAELEQHVHILRREEAPAAMKRFGEQSPMADHECKP